MTSDEVYKLIEANGLTLHGDIEHFAELVASAEREAILAVIGDNQCECRCSEVVRDRGQA
jgi:hypothetical protein